MSDAIHDEVKYRLRTVAAHYRSCGKHGTDPGDFVDREIEKMTDRLAGLLAPAPLREESRSDHTVQETAAYFARRVQRVGDRISDRNYRRSLVDVVALEGVEGFLDRIARDDLDVYATDAVNHAEGDGRVEG